MEVLEFILKSEENNEYNPTWITPIFMPVQL